MMSIQQEQIRGINLDPKIDIPEMAPAENRRKFVSCARVGISTLKRKANFSMKVGVLEARKQECVDAPHAPGRTP
jgi:hypothetical protein